jgi:thiosulfate/3-mercaptopyruvate sulfurtransferase
MTALTLPSVLVDVKWLAENINHPQLIILDASAHMPGAGRNASQEFKEKHIAHARFFDFNHQFADQQSDLPHMLPSAEVFTQEAQALGINQDSIVIIYDSAGIFSAPRGWWMFTAMGHTQCAVLNGGLPEWLIHSGTVESETNESGIKKVKTKALGNFTAQLQTEHVKNVNDMTAAIKQQNICILDARSEDRFNGTAKEPREGLISGHIPSSKSLPFTLLLQDGKYKKLDELKKLIEHRVDLDQPLYTSCGSGITACVIALAAHIVGIKSIAVYDGSWCEWGNPKNSLPINTTT